MGCGLSSCGGGGDEGLARMTGLNGGGSLGEAIDRCCVE